MTTTTWTWATEFGVKRLVSANGRIQIFRHTRRYRLRRPVFGNRCGTYIWYTVTIDRTPLYREYTLQREAKADALAITGARQ